MLIKPEWVVVWNPLNGASETTEQLPFHFSLSCTGEGNGSPLQCSCLENPRDGGLPSVGSHRVGHDWSDLAAAAAGTRYLLVEWMLINHRLYLALSCYWMFGYLKVFFWSSLRDKLIKTLKWQCYITPVLKLNCRRYLVLVGSHL